MINDCKDLLDFKHKTLMNIERSYNSNKNMIDLIFLYNQAISLNLPFKHDTLSGHYQFYYPKDNIPSILEWVNREHHCYHDPDDNISIMLRATRTLNIDEISDYKVKLRSYGDSGYDIIRTKGNIIIYNKPCLQNMENITPKSCVELFQSVGLWFYIDDIRVRNDMHRNGESTGLNDDNVIFYDQDLQVIKWKKLLVQKIFGCTDIKQYRNCRVANYDRYEWCLRFELQEWNYCIHLYH